MKKVLFFLLAFAFSLTVLLTAKPLVSQASVLTDAGLDYTESIKTVNNPYIGFIHREGVELNNDGALTFTDASEWVNGFTWSSPGWTIDDGVSVIWFNIDLKKYSPNMGGTAKDIAANDILSLEKLFDEIRKVNATCIVRFSYDMDGVTYTGENSADCEPSMDWILKHVSQLGKVITDNADVIFAVQSGMFGAWGEQHSTSFGNRDNVQGFYQLVEAWLNATPSDMPVLVRRPHYFLHWYNTKYNKSYTLNNINNIKIEENTPEARIGCYNDGYLGNSTDTGTYLNRNAEVGWLTNAKFVPFGGEVLADSSAKIKNEYDSGIGSYNSRAFIEQEGFLTHTSYLNYHYNYKNVIYHWENTTYTGNDAVYKNKTSDFQFIRNRLGYRLVLRGSRLTKTVAQGDNLQLEFDIENVGFGNITRKQNIYLVIADKNDNVKSITKTNLSEKSLLSKTTKTLSITEQIPSNFAEGSYKAYLKILSSYEAETSLLRSIKLANNGNIYNEKVGANLLGEFSVTKQTAQTSQTSKSTVSKSSSVKSSQNSQTGQASKSSASTQTSQVGQVSVGKSENQKPVVSTELSSSNAQSSAPRRSRSKKSSANNQTAEKRGCSSSATGEGSLVCFGLTLGAIGLILLKRKK